MEAQKFTVQDLAKMVHLLPSKDQGFAKDLVTQAGKRPLSEKQLYWVDRLTRQAAGLTQQEQSQGQNVGNFLGVYQLFQKAAKHLKFPKIRLSVDGLPVQLYVSGPNSKTPGVVNVTDGQPYGQNKWYGRVLKDGTWVGGSGYPEAGKIRGLLTKLAEKPAETAAEYGKLSGYCCFCNSQLTDEKSTAVGYGPVCAKNYGLPWGQKEGVLVEAMEKESA